MNAQIPPLTYTRFIGAIGPEQAGRVDVIGDVHGCFDELVDLLSLLGWKIAPARDDGMEPIFVYHPEGRHLVLAGDLTDRGPASDKVLRLLIGGQARGNVSCVMGNHDWKILRYLSGRPVEIRPSVQVTIDQILQASPGFPEAVRKAYARVPHQVRVALPQGHPYSDGGFLTVVHAAARAHHQDQVDKRSFKRSIYGYPTGKSDDDGCPERLDWAETYDGLRPVVHGHTPRRQARDLNRVICIDSGCVFGNLLTAYRVDSHEFLSVPARANHSGKNRILYY